MLETELKFFYENLPQWLEKHADRVALVKGAELVGLFDNEEQAVATGARLFGLESFLVRRVEAEEPSFDVPALTFGLLCASNLPPIARSQGQS